MAQSGRTGHRPAGPLTGVVRPFSGSVYSRGGLIVPLGRSACCPRHVAQARQLRQSPRAARLMKQGRQCRRQAWMTREGEQSRRRFWCFAGEAQCQREHGRRQCIQHGTATETVGRRFDPQERHQPRQLCTGSGPRPGCAMIGPCRSYKRRIRSAKCTGSNKIRRSTKMQKRRGRPYCSTGRRG
jgi:hypothetical protein